jgi:hypothetical protein
MTLIATRDNTSLHVAARAADAPAAAHASAKAAAQPHGARALHEAIQAVNDHRREVEMRRMALAAQQMAPAEDWPVPVQRAQLQALEQQARDAAMLRSLLDSGPVIAVPFSALPPYTLRDMPPSLAHAIGDDEPDAAKRDRPLTRLFAATDIPRLQQALYDGDATTLIAHLRRADGRAQRCSVHLSARDPSDPDRRWACIVRLPQAATAAQPHHERHVPAKSNQRPRVEAWPASSA